MEEFDKGGQGPTVTKATHTNFGARLRCLPEIFADGRRFQVPDYQRGYAWETRHVQDLLDDIEQHLALPRDNTWRHYTGTLVLVNNASAEVADTKVFDVVDGQQRLTTLVILMARIAARLDDDKRAGELRRTYLTRGRPGNEQAVLLLNKDDAGFFSQDVLGLTAGSGTGNIVLQSHERLRKAGETIDTWLDAQIGRIEQLLQVLEQDLGFLVYTPQNNAETGIMFEVINNRGRPLSELEKVKNYLIYCAVLLNASTLRQEIDEAWSRILRNLSASGRAGQAQESAFLRYCLVVHYGLSKHDSQHGYEQIKRRIRPETARATAGLEDDTELVRNVRGLLSFLDRASSWYQRLHYPSGDLGPELDLPLEKLRVQGDLASIMPLFFAVLLSPAGDGPKLEASQKAGLLHWLEKLNFRVYIARNVTARTDSGQAELYKLAAAFHNGCLQNLLDSEDRTVLQGTSPDPVELLRYRLTKFIQDWAPHDRFMASFDLATDDPGDFYDWSGLRYFLIRYEQSLRQHKTIPPALAARKRADGKSNDYLSVEHLWATAFRADENNRPQDRHERRRLGNFVLLGLRFNIQASNDFIEDKLDRWVSGCQGSTDLEQVRELGAIVRQALAEEDNRGAYHSKNYYLRIHQRINAVREASLKKFAAREWAICDEPRYQALLDYRKAAEAGS